METKGIDLTNCNNLRARFRDKDIYENKERMVIGRIEKNGDIKGEFNLYTDDGEYVDLFYDGKFSENVIDFEIVPRDPDTYQDWQVGDVIWDTHESGDNGKVIFRNGEFVAAEIIGMCRCYTCQELFHDGYRLALTDIEQQIIEERKKAEWKPQDGDICFVKTSAGNRFIFIKRDNESDDEIHGYISINTNIYVLYLSSDLSCVCERKSIRELRPATDEERQLLFDAMAKQGKRWNAEKKVVEDIPQPYEFKKGDPVLVRTASGNNWRIAVFSRKRDTVGDFEVVYGNGCGYYGYCIPYNKKTMHLLGTTEDYKEE